MNEFNLKKGIHALKQLAINIRSFAKYSEGKNDNDSAVLMFLEEMNHYCAILTEIFENEFTNMVTENERMEDDGK